MEEFTYGEIAVGLDSQNPMRDDVREMKIKFSKIIDDLNEARNEAGHSEKGRILSVAITEAQTAQMWAVKGITQE